MQDWHMSSTLPQSMQWYRAGEFSISPQWRQATNEQSPHPSNQWNSARKASCSESHLLIGLIWRNIKHKAKWHTTLLMYVCWFLLGKKSLLRWSRYTGSIWSSKLSSVEGSGIGSAVSCFLEHGVVTQDLGSGTEISISTETFVDGYLGGYLGKIIVCNIWAWISPVQIILQTSKLLIVASHASKTFAHATLDETLTISDHSFCFFCQCQLDTPMLILLSHNIYLLCYI